MMLFRRLMGPALRIGILTMAACSAAMLLAKDDDEDTGDHRGRPPQVAPRGFESSDRLLRDVARAERGPKYSAWIVESSRFLNVPHRAFSPMSAIRPSVDLPVNVGIIKAPNGDITLYDAGWKQLRYIFDWNTSCCWHGLRDQMTAIGLDPERVIRIVLGHGHWDHSGQLSEFPNAVVYIQKEELKQIDFFLDYPADVQRRPHPRCQHRRSAHGRTGRTAAAGLRAHARRAAIRRRRCRRFSARCSRARPGSSTAGTSSPRAWSSTRRSAATPTARSFCRSTPLAGSSCSAATPIRRGRASATGWWRTSSRPTRSSSSSPTRSATS